ncbi:unnamed protein product [Effrenium voratum]|uniref:Uncharacterized protein n=1 Tax=Effrenium voratum TaxID=2562239 RepID=A0AA36IEU6_9DINO|nr:unnamed protein product [Effrenium voratum]CAJ1452620.1 unnamed protein product [Effrenium voratum]
MGKFIPVAAGQACPAVLKAERAEGGAKRSAACSAVRCFLVSQCIFELLAVAIRHPSSDRLLQIFCALVVRLLRGGLGAGGPQQAAAAALAPALAEQLLCQLRLADASAQALAAASAALSPCLPLEAFSPVLPALLAKLGANCAEAFKALMASLALSAKTKHNELDLNSFVPRLLSLMPLEPPKAVAFHSGAAGVLALCSHTAAITSLCRPWVVSTAMALLRSALRPGGLQRVRAAVPLAAAMAAVGQKPMEPENWEVEENISFQRRPSAPSRAPATPPRHRPPNKRPRRRCGASACRGWRCWVSWKWRRAPTRPTSRRAAAVASRDPGRSLGAVSVALAAAGLPVLFPCLCGRPGPAGFLDLRVPGGLRRREELPSVGPAAPGARFCHTGL